MPPLSWQGIRNSFDSRDAAIQDALYKQGSSSEFLDKILAAGTPSNANVATKHQTVRPPPPGYSEDCLYLNIWSPSTAKKNNAKLPIMMWIHGGAHQDGSIVHYDGSTLCQQGRQCVVVCVQYRLGVMGFFTHPELKQESSTGESCGNYGLMDHVRAMEWIKNNGSFFGGDPNNITIFGESAGGTSVNTMMVCPSAQGLFSRAISQSGSGVSVGHDLNERCNVGVDFQKHVNCTSLNDLRNLSAEQIQRGTMRNPNDTNLIIQPFRFNVVTDGIVIPKQGLEKVFQQGQHHNVPFIVGFNAEEGGSMWPLIKAPTIQVMSNMNVLQHWPIVGYKKLNIALKAMFGPEESLNYQKSVQLYLNSDFALKGTTKDERADKASIVMSGDNMFGAPSEILAAHAANSHETHGTAPCYMYLFTRTPSGRAGEQMGSYHGSEIDFVFGSGLGLAKMLPAPGDERLKEVMSTAWVDFAHDGKIDAIEWKKYSSSNKGTVMEFGQGGVTGMIRDVKMMERFELLDESDLSGRDKNVMLKRNGVKSKL